jgi:hypothetical protein
MYPTIDAIAKGGIIEPLEPVKFDDNEHLYILRLSKPMIPSAGSRPVADWREFAGTLKSSPNFNEDPVALQRELRNEWS